MCCFAGLFYVVCGWQTALSNKVTLTLGGQKSWATYTIHLQLLSFGNQCSEAPRAHFFVLVLIPEECRSTISQLPLRNAVCISTLMGFFHWYWSSVCRCCGWKYPRENALQTFENLLDNRCNFQILSVCTRVHRLSIICAAHYLLIMQIWGFVVHFNLQIHLRLNLTVHHTVFVFALPFLVAGSFIV